MDEFIELAQRLSGSTWRLAVLQWLRDHPKSSAREIAEGLGTTRQQIFRALHELRDWKWLQTSVPSPDIRPVRYSLNHEQIGADLKPYLDFIDSLT